MKPWINKKLDIGFVFTVKAGSSTLRRWGSDNGFEPVDFRPTRLIGIVREPRSRFISMVQQYMVVYANDTLEEDPGVFDRTWPQLAAKLQSGQKDWHKINPHFVKQSIQMNLYHPSEYWPLDELDERIKPVLEEFNLPTPNRRKQGNAHIKQRIEDGMMPAFEDIVRDLYKEDFALYEKIKNI